MILGALAAVLALMAAPSASAEEVASGKVAELRALDRISGALTDLFVPVGEGVVLGPLAVSVVECRYPVANPASDSEAHVTIIEETTQSELFRGWMLASSPALSALDHPRYDVWVLSCVLPEAPAEAAEE